MSGPGDSSEAEIPQPARSTPAALLRSVGAVVGGLLLISLITETVEVALVTAVNGRPTTDMEAYYAIRNRGWLLAVKLVYNGGAAVAGGYVAAWIARSHAMLHAMGLAALQTAAFGWAIGRPELRRWMPLWMWTALVILTVPAILLGGHLRAQRRRSTSA